MTQMNASFEYKYEKISMIIDVKTFDICQIKESEYGRWFRKKKLFVHFDGWKFALLIEDDKGQFKQIIIERETSPSYTI